MSPRVDFINILRSAFRHVGPKAQKVTADLTDLNAHVKASSKMLMKLTPGD